jgi:quercetin dioxygenase-like cupin family protein
MIESPPQMAILHTGKLLKVLQVTGIAGMRMPEHISTKEAVIIIQKGSAVITMKGNDYLLQKHESMIIPGGEKHTLRITEDFQAHVIMETDSQIKFINS